MPRLLSTCALLLGAAWLLPLHVLPWMSWHNEIAAVACVLVGCAGALWLARSSRSPVVIPSLAWLPGLIAAVALVQWGTGRIAYAGSLWAILAFALLCIASATAGRACVGADRRAPVTALRILAQGLVLIGVAQVFVVFAQTFNLWSGSDWVARTAYATRGGGNVAQPNQAALLFVLAIASTFYLRQLGALRPGAAGVLLLVLASGLATAQSRSGMLALAVLLAWAFWKRRALPAGLSWSAGLGFGLLAFVQFALWPQLMDGYWHTDIEEVNLTTSGRTEMWRQLLAAVQLRPWTGWGVMQVAEAQNAVAHRYEAVMAATFSHNVFLDLALWIGVPGMVLAVSMVVAWLWPRVRQVATADDWYCIALALPVAVQSMTEFPYAYAYVLAPVLFALGVLDARLGGGARLRVPRAVAAGVVAVWAAGTLWSIVEYVGIEEDFRVARFEALRVGQTPAAYELPRTHLLTQLDALLRATRVKPRPGMPEEEITLLRNVAMLHPWGATNFRYATALALNGRMEEALRQLQVLRALQGRKSFQRLLEALDEMSAEYPVLKQLRQP